jgi:hypothetical protein
MGLVAGDTVDATFSNRTLADPGRGRNRYAIVAFVYEVGRDVARACALLCVHA